MKKANTFRAEVSNHGYGDCFVFTCYGEKSVGCFTVYSVEEFEANVKALIKFGSRWQDDKPLVLGWEV